MLKKLTFFALVALLDASCSKTQNQTLVPVNVKVNAIETLDAQGNALYTNTVTNVPFKRNRLTRLTGSVYTNSSVGSSFQLNTDWISAQEIAF